MVERDKPGRRKATVVLDPAKNRQTTHWDVDLLPEAELARMRRAGRRARWRRGLTNAGLAVGVVAVAGAVTALVLSWVG